jgi:hypothetical protein
LRPNPTANLVGVRRISPMAARLRAPRTPVARSSDSSSTADPEPGDVPKSLPLSAGGRPRRRRALQEQWSRIRATLARLVHEDLARGIDAERKLYCDACERARPAPGFVQYRRYLLCNGCALEYELGLAVGKILSAGQYVRDKHFGEAEAYLVSEA